MRRKLSYDMPINEEKVMKIIAVSKAAFLSGEAEQMVSPGEFLIMQSKLIQKRWWFLQGLILAVVCLFLCHMETDYLIRCVCSKGTYIRTLCHDIGMALDAPAHMRFLLRTRHGSFSIEQCVTVEEVMQAAQEGEMDKLLLPMDYPLQEMKRLDVGEKYATPVKNGAKLPLQLMPDAAENEIFRVYLNGTLCGLYRKDEDVLHCCIGLYQE